MFNSRICLLIVVLQVVLLTSCKAPATAPSFHVAKATESQENKSIFYFYREYAEPTAWKSTIYIDDVEIVSLAQESFSWVYLGPGKHKFASRWSFLSGQRDVEFTEDILPNKRYFYEITGVSKVTGFAPYPSGILMFGMVQNQITNLEEDKAVPQLEKCCRFIPPKTNNL
ncbi:hypothetical protein [Methylophilus sp. YYY-1]|uniref:hypothetical protein n=1 Tax=Methylophilus sp. YYY-1 TaxID=2682087 RepID=UPI0023B2654A|nr:hypothetical protein [Methylophilus sp. YYY-1]MDF0378601.1 DUF2846 domain-containing protein [Methylophilus sp. YYY-1]